MDSRAEKLKELAGDEYFGDASSIVEPDSVRTSLQNVRIGWNEEPDEITIEGVRVTPREIAGKTLRVLAPARIFARKGARFAFGEVAHNGGGIKSVTLDLVAPPDSDSTREELEQLRREQKWFRLFLATTTQSVAPRSAAVALYFNFASRRLFGDANNTLPLSTWRPSH